LIIDDGGGLLERINSKYKQVYLLEYETILPDIANIYNNVLQKKNIWTKIDYLSIKYKLRFDDKIFSGLKYNY